MNPLVGIIVLNYNRANDTIECVVSLQQCNYRDVFVVVVDNGSTDGSEEILRNHLSGIEVLQTGRNLGFAAGNNWAFEKIAAKNPKYVLLLNNDTIVDPGFLGKMISSMEQDEELAAAGSTVLQYPKTNLVWYGGGKFKFWRASSVSNFAGENRGELPTEVDDSVTFITGCSLLLRVAVIERLGLFDERYFMYFEDAELSMRLITRGYKLLYVPESIVFHKVGLRKETPFTMYYGVRNRFLFIKSSTYGLRKLIAYLYLTIVFAFKALVWLLKRRDLTKSCIMGAVDFVRGLWGPGRGFDLARQ